MLSQRIFVGLQRTFFRSICRLLRMQSHMPQLYQMRHMLQLCQMRHTLQLYQMHHMMLFECNIPNLEVH